MKKKEPSESVEVLGQNERPPRPTKFTSHAQKQVECDKCGYVSEVTAFIPLKLACCKECGSTKIRLYKPAKKGRSDGDGSKSATASYPPKEKP